MKAQGIQVGILTPPTNSALQITEGIEGRDLLVLSHALTLHNIVKLLNYGATLKCGLKSPCTKNVPIPYT